MSEERKGFRLTKIYTRTGDKGTTRIGGGEVLSKSDLRIEAIGTVDELNSWMGMFLNVLKPSGDLTAEQYEQVASIQHRLFDVGGELAMPGYKIITPEHTTQLEQLIDELNEHIPPAKNFTLPGGGTTATHGHVARTVSRRAERAVIRLKESGAEINEPLMSYLNRLSDVLYVLCRHCARKNEGEVLWVASPTKKNDD